MKIALKVARKHFFGVMLLRCLLKTASFKVFLFFLFGNLNFISLVEFYSQDGTPPERVAELLVSWGANSVGVNCDGPARVTKLLLKWLNLQGSCCRFSQTLFILDSN